MLLALSVLLLLGLLMAGLLVPPRRTLVRSVTISARPPKVYPLVSNLRNGWPKWSPMATQRDGAVFQVQGPASGLGATGRWDGAAGSGSLTISRAETNRLVAWEVDTGIAGLRSTGRLDLLPGAGGCTRVTWTDDIELGSNPLVRWLGVAMERMRARDLERGLEDLKRAVAL